MKKKETNEQLKQEKEIVKQQLEEENNKLKETIEKLKKENEIIKQKMREENDKLKETIEQLKKENVIIKQKIEEENNKYNEKIKSLEKDLQDKNNELNNYFNQKNKLNENILTSLKLGDKIISVNFMSMGNQDIINYSMPCKKTDLFVSLEEKLYNDFPKYKNYETYFEVNLKRIKRFKTIEENNIKGNDIISMFVIEE